MPAVVALLPHGVDIGIDEETLNKTAVTLKIFLSNHFQEALQHHPLFRGLFVYGIDSDSDGAYILRIALAYKKMSMDAFLEQIHIPFSVNELVTEIHGELSSNVHMIDLINTTSASLDHLLAAKLYGSAQVRTELVTPILERLVLALRSAPSQSFMKQVQESSRLQEQQHKEYYAHMKAQQQIREQAMTTIDPKTGTVNTALLKPVEEPAEFIMTDQWEDIRPYFPLVAEWAETAINCLRGTQVNSLLPLPSTHTMTCRS